MVWKVKEKIDLCYCYINSIMRWESWPIFLQVLERFLGTIPENNRYQQQILSMYLSCSGYTEPQNKCLDRVVCDYSDTKSSIPQEEKDVISM